MTHRRIFDRLREVARPGCGATAASIETPPGGTVILNRFLVQPARRTITGCPPARTSRAGALGPIPLVRISPTTAPPTISTAPASSPSPGSTTLSTGGGSWGLSAGYTHADLTLSPSSISRQVDGALVGPYAAYIFNPNWSLDALANWTSLSNNITAPLPFPAGSYHSNRVTAASNLNYLHHLQRDQTDRVRRLRLYLGGRQYQLGAPPGLGEQYPIWGGPHRRRSCLPRRRVRALPSAAPSNTRQRRRTMAAAVPRSLSAPACAIAGATR